MKESLPSSSRTDVNMSELLMRRRSTYVQHETIQLQYPKQCSESIEFNEWQFL